jgi:hypothetical protein
MGARNISTWILIVFRCCGSVVGCAPERYHAGTRATQQLASSSLPFDGKLLKPNRGEVAERLNAAVC